MLSKYNLISSSNVIAVLFWAMFLGNSALADCHWTESKVWPFARYSSHANSTASGKGL